MYVIVITAADGTISAAGPVKDKYRATMAANDIETMDSDSLAAVCVLEPLADVMTYIQAGEV